MSDEKDLSLEKDKKQNEVDYSCGLESEEEHAAVYPEEEKEEGCCCGEDHECNCEGDDGCGWPSYRAGYLFHRSRCLSQAVAAARPKLPIVNNALLGHLHSHIKRRKPTS